MKRRGTKRLGELTQLPPGWNPNKPNPNREKQLKRKRVAKKIAKYIGIATIAGATAVLGGKPLFHLLGERLDADNNFQKERLENFKKLQKQGGEPKNFYQAPNDSSMGGM